MPKHLVEVSLVYTKSGESEKENLVKGSKLILCSQETVFVLIWDSEKFCVHRRWIQSYFRFHENFVFTRELDGVGPVDNRPSTD